MYSTAQIRRGLRRSIDDPTVVARECNRVYHRHLYRRSYNTDGIDVMAADWDTLVVLDACRYDTFAAESELPGDLEARESRGSHTVEFLEGNVAHRDLEDTVYVTASPQLRKWWNRIDPRFHDVIDVWREDGWDDEHHTVLPETMVSYARDAIDQYPNKRLVVHLLQPHYPFIDAPAELNPRRFGEAADRPDIWRLLRTGDATVPPEAVRSAYRDNHTRALPAVRELMDAVDGRTVVTSDHGNMFGERARPIPFREWGHPPGVYTDELVRVPWLVHSSGPRRRVTSGEQAAASVTVDEAVVNERLEQLGYVS